jgi:hypothetical protein
VKLVSLLDTNALFALSAPDFRFRLPCMLNAKSTIFTRQAQKYSSIQKSRKLDSKDRKHYSLEENRLHSGSTE